MVLRFISSPSSSLLLAPFTPTEQVLVVKQGHPIVLAYATVMDPMFSCYDDSSGLIPTTPTFAWNPLLPSPPSTVHPAQSTSEHSEGDNSTSTNSGEYRDRLDSVGSTVREPNAGKTCVACVRIVNDAPPPCAGPRFSFITTAWKASQM